MAAKGLLLVNRKSRAGETGAGVFRTALAKSGFEVAVRLTVDLADMRAAIDAAAADPTVDFVAVGGGDGTLSGAAPALLRLGKPVAIVPLGTANDLARTLDIPATPEAAAEIVAAGHIRRIDVGTVDGRPFFNVATIGLGTEIVRAHRGPAKRLLGVFNYPRLWWRAYRSSQPFRATIVYDGNRIAARCMQIAVGNGRYYGGGMTVHEEAEIDDGLLHLYYVRPTGFLGWLRLLPALRWGRLNSAQTAVSVSAARVTVATRRSLPVSVDGEIVTRTPVAFGVQTAALPVFAPAPEQHGRQAA